MLVRLFDEKILDASCIEPTRAELIYHPIPGYPVPNRIVLNEDALERLWYFLLQMRVWRLRVKPPDPIGPPQGFDQDITERAIAFIEGRDPESVKTTDHAGTGGRTPDASNALVIATWGRLAEDIGEALEAKEDPDNHDAGHYGKRDWALIAVLKSLRDLAALHAKRLPEPLPSDNIGLKPREAAGLTAFRITDEWLNENGITLTTRELTALVDTIESALANALTAGELNRTLGPTPATTPERTE